MVVGKALLGGVLVLAFAVLAEPISPKRLAGVMAAAPSVALASLTVTLLAKGPLDARRACAGMAAGAIGFVVYCLVAPPLIHKLSAVRGAALSLTVWFAVSAVALPLFAATSFAKATAGVGIAHRHRPVRHRTRPQLELDKLKQLNKKETLVRFGFGAATSALAGVLSILFGPVIGGVFLAFPAILLASLTLVADEEGRSAARDEARGAGAGALGLIGFAVIGMKLLSRHSSVLSCAAATGCWVLIGYGTYLLAWLAGHGSDEKTGD